MGLLYDHLCNHIAMHNGSETDDVQRGLLTSPVYEVTNVVSLFKDWEKEKTSPIPKVPPHDRMWAEWIWDWSSDRLQCAINFTQGCFIWKHDAQSLLEQSDTGSVGLLRRAIGDGNQLWLVCPWARVNRVQQPREPVTRLKPGLIYGSNEMVLVALDADGLIADMTGISALGTLWGLGAVDFQHTGGLGMWVFPPFMAFSLLHCRNVTTETVQGEPNPARLVKRGWPPLKKEYKVLRLELPKDLRPRPATEAEADEERKMRFHLCRGHFKNLQHERYKAKGWHWWPAHWRGSKDLGEIEKRYELTAKTPATSEGQR